MCFSIDNIQVETHNTKALYFYKFATMSVINIVGQGLSGSILAYKLMQKGQAVKIINQYLPQSTSSWVAGGIFNPVTGRRMNLTWLADEIFANLYAFYPAIEKELAIQCFYPKDVIRLFDNIENQNDWLGRANTGLYAPYAQGDSFVQLDEKAIINPFGGIKIQKGGYVNTFVLLEAFRNYFLEMGVLIEVEEPVQASYFEEVEKVIWCTGYMKCQIDYFDNLPHLPVKGELLTLYIPSLSLDAMVMGQGLFVLPIADGYFRVGATYNWDLSNLEISVEALDELLGKLRKIIPGQHAIVVKDHMGGVRPATKDRRPFIGKDQLNGNCYYFSGFGSKGVSLIPYFADSMVQHLLHEIALPESTNLERFNANL